MASARGPLPNRTDDLSRERDANRNGRDPIKRGISVPSSQPPANPEWDEVATMLYNSVGESGIREFYEASDWALLYLLCDDLSYIRHQKEETGKYTALIYQTVISALNGLGLTEGDRRRIRIELDSQPEEEGEATLTIISDYQAKLAESFKAREA